MYNFLLILINNSWVQTEKSDKTIDKKNRIFEYTNPITRDTTI